MGGWQRVLRGGGTSGALLRGASAFLVLQVLGQLLQLVAQVVLARSIGSASYGIFAFSTSVLAFAVVVAGLGLPKATLRFLPEYAASDDPSALRGFLEWSARLVLVASLASGAAIAIAAAFAPAMAPEWRSTLIVAGAVLVPSALLPLFASRLRAWKAIARAQLPVAVVQPVVLLAAIATLALVLGPGMDATWAIGARGAAALVALVLAIAFTRATRPSSLAAADAVSSPARWRAVALPLAGAGALQVVLQHLDVLMLASWLDEASVGIYAAAARASALLGWGLLAVSSWAAPTIAERFFADDRRGLQHLVRLSARLATGFAIAGGMLFALAGRPLLALFGPDFVAAHAPLLCLAMGQIVNAATGPAGFLLTMTGHQRAATWVEAGAAGLAVLLLVALIPRYGTLGAAVGTATALAARNLAMAVLAARRVGVRSFVV